MMDSEVIKDVIAAHAQLVEKAIRIVSGPPYGTHVDEPLFATLAIDAETAILRWPARRGDYPGLDAQEVAFPVALLGMSDEEISGWKRRG